MCLDMEILQLLTRVNIHCTLPERSYSFFSPAFFFSALLEPWRPCCWATFWKVPQGFCHVCFLLNKQLQQRTWFTQKLQMAAILQRKLKGASSSRNVNTQFNVTCVIRICLFLTKQPYKTDYKDVLHLVLVLPIIICRTVWAGCVGREPNQV